jgi:hypothetical protein
MSQYHEIPGRERPMNRRVFVIEAGKAFPAIAGALYLIACGGSSPSAPSTVADITTVSTVVNAHTHSVGVPASDQLKGNTTTYTSSSTLAHDHMVTLTASQMSTLGAGGAVTVSSTNSTVTGNHSHDFTFQGKKS